jgi:hypothetical protein
MTENTTTETTMFERPPVFEFKLGDRVGIKDHLHLRATGCTRKAYDLTYPEGFTVVDIVSYNRHGHDYQCEPIVDTPHSRTMFIEERYLKELDTV